MKIHFYILEIIKSFTSFKTFSGELVASTIKSQRLEYFFSSIADSILFL